MTPQELKNSILQLAIQCRLAPQRPEEGTAEELYRQIQREKAALAKAGKIKKEKPLPEITEEEVPFEIPEGWKWVRIGQVFNLQAGKNVTSADIYDFQSEDHSYQCYGGNGVRGFVSDFNREGNYVIIGRQGALCGNINIADGQFYATEHAVVVDHFGLTDVKWGAYFLRALNLNQYATATAQPGLAVSNIIQVAIPLPPLGEQKRIVAKIEELMPYIYRYEMAWSRLEDFNKRFPTDMQKSILQLAIQGKLVPQRPEEGTGEALYQQIQAEKQSLIRSGKLKKEKPFPEIAPDEIPFDIPESWKWVRIGDVTQFLSGFAFKSSDFKSEGRFRLFRGINLSVNQIRWDDTVYVDETSDRLSEYLLMSGDVLLGLDRPWISDGIRVAIWAEALDTYLVQRVLRIRATCGITNHYIALLLRSSLLKESLISKTTGISVPHISPGQVANVVVPLPPLIEQKRIVAKLEELLPLCGRLT